jgi:LPXTG-site transpeptidase (sortase) family protein
MIRRVQLVLFVVAGVTAAWVAYGSVRAAVYREVNIARIENSPLSAPLPAATVVVADAKVADEDVGVGPDGVVGVLEIPRLKLSEVVASGEDDKTLKVAIGHLLDTPLPWAQGNSVLAAHRDTHFRPLRDIQHGDVVRLKTRKGVFEYSVKDTMIVAPTDVWVMAPSKERRLTLVTCYPFNYVGSAPQRFIVRADAR